MAGAWRIGRHGQASHQVASQVVWETRFEDGIDLKEHPSPALAKTTLSSTIERQWVEHERHGTCAQWFKFLYCV